MIWQKQNWYGQLGYHHQTGFWPGILVALSEKSIALVQGYMVQPAD